jgi:hypothetical protein
MAGTPTYDPGSIIATFGGILITGYGPDTFITASYNTDAFTLQVGSGGDGCRTRSQDKSGTVTFTLLQSSPVNDLLAALALVDRQAGSGSGALLIKDNNGTSLVSAENAWIKKVPETPFAKEAGVREWVLESLELEITPGGIIVS